MLATTHERGNLMKTTEKRVEYIRLRAEGKSYRAIEAEAGISRSTCSEWEKELSPEIARLRQENLEALYTEYGMMREARIRRIGDTLRRIDQAIADKPIEALPLDKLLDYKLKYAAALRDEYTSTAYTEASGAAGDTLEAIQSVYRRISSGEATTAQAKVELSVLDHLADGYNRAHPFADLFRDI